MKFFRNSRFAVLMIFAINGALFGTWASRIPAISNIHNLSNQTYSSSINTTTQIIGNKKITKIEKTEHTPNGTISTVEEYIEFI